MTFFNRRKFDVVERHVGSSTPRALVIAAQCLFCSTLNFLRYRSPFLSSYKPDIPVSLAHVGIKLLKVYLSRLTFQYRLATIKIYVKIHLSYSKSYCVVLVKHFAGGLSIFSRFASKGPTSNADRYF